MHASAESASASLRMDNGRDLKDLLPSSQFWLRNWPNMWVNCGGERPFKYRFANEYIELHSFAYLLDGDTSICVDWRQLLPLPMRGWAAKIEIRGPRHYH
jgi:hypothetical protein